MQKKNLISLLSIPPSPVTNFYPSFIRSEYFRNDIQVYLIAKRPQIYYPCNSASSSPDVPQNNLYFKTKTPVIYQLQLGPIQSSAAVKLVSISSLQYCANVK